MCKRIIHLIILLNYYYLNHNIEPPAVCVIVMCLSQSQHYHNYYQQVRHTLIAYECALPTYVILQPKDKMHEYVDEHMGSTARESSAAK